jgi:hypothetical protein
VVIAMGTGTVITGGIGMDIDTATGKDTLQGDGQVTLPLTAPLHSQPAAIFTEIAAMACEIRVSALQAGQLHPAPDNQVVRSMHQTGCKGLVQGKIPSPLVAAQPDRPTKTMCCQTEMATSTAGKAVEAGNKETMVLGTVVPVQRHLKMCAGITTTETGALKEPTATAIGAHSRPPRAQDHRAAGEDDKKPKQKRICHNLQDKIDPITINRKLLNP